MQVRVLSGALGEFTSLIGSELFLINQRKYDMIKICIKIVTSVKKSLLLKEVFKNSVLTNVNGTLNALTVKIEYASINNAKKAFQ